jgi:hypothetical protein
MMPLEKRDEIFMHINEVIDAKRNMLIEKQKKIKYITKQNHFLEDVKNDYFNYHNYIIKQKYDQMTALSMLDHYIKDLTVSGKLSKQNISDAKQEQQKIIRELNSIKKSLDEMIKDTEYISSTIKEKNIL